MRRAPILAVLATSVALALTGCAGSSDTGGTTAPSASETAAPELSGELTVYAAASLQKAFDEIAAEFEAENPGVTVNPISYDGSSTLATQIIGGAGVDVFASADEANMAKVTDEGLAEDPELFATNTLVLAVPAGNPAGVSDIADLADPATRVVLCAVEVPCGAASQKLLEADGVSVTPASFEQNVTAVLTKVRSGEADAGLVYATDVVGDAEVESSVPEGAADVVNSYPIVALSDAPDAEIAAAFVAFVTGEKGQAVLAELGFGAP